MVGVTNGLAYLNLHCVPNLDSVYEILSQTQLTNAVAQNWNIEEELFPPDTNQNVVPFTVAEAGRTNLFLWAQDWTGVTGNGNTTPDWYFYFWFGTTALTDATPDAFGNTLLSDYEDYADGIVTNDPNVILFTIAVVNNYVNQSSPALSLNVTAGMPRQYAVLVDSTNYAAANWRPYTSPTVTASLGSIEGWHQLWVGLKGCAPNATATWQWKQLKLEVTPPLLVVTNPILGSGGTAAVTVPVAQVQGYCPDQIAGISYDLANALGVVTNQSGGITDQFYNHNTCEITTNWFECVDVPLTTGLNVITLHATDLAGNTSTTNLSLTLDYSSRTHPPAVQLYWPQTGALVCGGNYTWRGWVDDPTATVVAQVVDTSGNTNIFNGMVERDGKFWVENLPAVTGTNYLTLTTTDSAGNVAVTNITVLPGAIGLTITLPDGSQLWNQGITVSGTISDSVDYSVWVNGVPASLDGSGNWTATNLDLPTGGTALIQARAILNSDNGGAGTGGSGGGPVTYDNLGNPNSATANDAESQANKQPYLYIATYTDADTEHINWSDHAVPDGTPWASDVISANIAGSWTNGLGGSSSWTWEDIHADSVPELYTNSAWLSAAFPPSWYPDIQERTTNASSDDLDNPFKVKMEHCHIGAPPIDDSGDLTIPPTSTTPYVVHEVLNRTQTRQADAIMKLQTGGKPGVGRQGLFMLSATAYQYYLIKNPFDLVSPPPPLGANVPPQNIQILGQPLGSDGNLWVVLPDGVQRIVSPKVSGADYYTWGEPTPPKYPLAIVANGVTLDPDDVVTNASFCVGQDINLSLASYPPYLSATFNWILPGVFENATTNAGPYCSTDPYVNTNLLTNATTSAWWVSGGTPTNYSVSADATFTFANGQSVAATPSGQFHMFRPTSSIAVGTGTVQNGNNYYSSAGSLPQFALHYGNNVLHDNFLSPGIYMSCTVVASPLFPGTSNWVQVVKSAYRTAQTNDSSGAWYGLNPSHVLDGSDPYSDFAYYYGNPFVIDPPKTGPNPGDDPTTFATYTANDEFDMWLMFQAASAAHKVPLKMVDWKWNGNGSLSNGNWILNSNPQPDPHPTVAESYTYPSWTNIMSNFSTHLMQ